MCGRPIRFCSDSMKALAKVTGYQHAHAALCDRRLVQSMYGECDVLMERVLLTLHGEPHTCRRAIEWKLFRRDFARYYEREVYPVTLAQTLGPYLDQGRLDLPEFGFRVNINLSADIAGIDRPEGSKSEADALVALPGNSVRARRCFIPLETKQSSATRLPRPSHNLTRAFLRHQNGGARLSWNKSGGATCPKNKRRGTS